MSLQIRNHGQSWFIQPERATRNRRHWPKGREDKDNQGSHGHHTYFRYTYAMYLLGCVLWITAYWCVRGFLNGCWGLFLKSWGEVLANLYVAYVARLIFCITVGEDWFTCQMKRKFMHTYIQLHPSMYGHLSVSLLSLSGDSGVLPAACRLLASFASVQVFVWLQLPLY